jgi:Fe-S-cluster-containing dehydrogenase component
VRPAMVIDLNRCIGCLACTIACIRENIAHYRDGEPVYPEGNIIFYARTKPAKVTLPTTVAALNAFIQCMHCDDPPCEHVCPTGATYRTPEGVVMLDHNKCIGCRACVIACPYGARTVYRGPQPEGEPLNEAALAPGYPDKCTFCYHRREEAGGGLWVPACVEVCAFGARLFGDLDNPDDPVAKLVNEGEAIALYPAMGTKPKLFFVPPKKSLYVPRQGETS